jgi:hypothetical protein
VPPRLGLLIGAQFASALADNALLIAAVTRPPMRSPRAA